MRPIWIWPLLVGMAWASLGASAAVGQNAAEESDRVEAEEILALVLERPRGEVTIEPGGVPVQALQSVPDGTTFKLAAGAELELLCASGAVVQLRASGTVTAERCRSKPGGVPESYQALVPVAGRIKAWRGSLVLEGETRERRDDYGLRPVVLAPRCPVESSAHFQCTQLLEPPARLRFTAVQGAKHYELTLDSQTSTVALSELTCEDGGPHLPHTVCSLPWPAAWKLTPGRKSFLHVVAQTGLFPRDKYASEKNKLQLVSEAEAGPWRADVEKLRQLGVGAAAEHLLLAAFYAEKGLANEAISHLEALALPAAEPMLHLALGEAYLRVDLLYPASLRFESVVRRLTGQASPVLAAAELGLGRVYQRAKNKAKALEHMQRAQALYTSLGLAAAAAEAAEGMSAVASAAPPRNRP